MDGRRPGGLFDASVVSDYRAGASRLPGRYTARPDLAHEVLRQAVGNRRSHVYIDVRTTHNTPSPLELIRNEAVSDKAGRRV